MDPAYWALKLEEAPSFAIEADSTGINALSYLCASTIRYDFPARGEMPPVTLIWRDGGRKPALPAGWPGNRQCPCFGTFLIGDRHTLVVDQVTERYERVRLVPPSLMVAVHGGRL